MVAAAYTSDLTDIDMMEGVGSVGDYGGGGGAASAGIDYAIEGTNAVDKQVNASERGFLFDNVTNFTIAADDHFFGWICVGTYGLADTRDARGIVLNIGDDTSNFVKFHVNGVDTLPLGGMIPYAVRFVETTLTNFRTLVGTPGTTPSQIGCGANITGGAKFANLAMDAVRIGTGYDILNGTGADPEANFAGIAADDLVAREGIFLAVGGGYNLQGKLRIGSAATACEFLDLNTNIFAVEVLHGLVDFTEILIEHASSILTLTNVNFIALGTGDNSLNLGRFEVLTSAAVLTLTNVGFIDWGVTVLGTGSTLTGCRWIGAAQVTANGATLTGSSISGYETAADTGGLLWNTATNPDGFLDDMSFTKGTAATHAIEFGASAPQTMTLRGLTVSGYSGTGTSATFLFADTGSDVTWNVTVIEGTGTFTGKKARAGDTINIIQDNQTSFEGLVNGSEVRIFTTATTTELDGVESVTGGKFDFVYTGTPTVDVVVMKTDYVWLKLIGLVMKTGATNTIPVVQQFERYFSNP